MTKTTKAAAKAQTGIKIKYMGSADRMLLEAGEDFGGRLSDPLEQDVLWDWGNHHVVDSDEVGLSAAACKLLLEDTNRFLDVSDHDIVPVNLAQILWRGARPDADSTDVPAEDNGAIYSDGTSHGAGGSVTPATPATGVGGAGTD